MDFNLKALFPLFRKLATRAGAAPPPALLREVAVLTPEAVLARFDSSDEGLTEGESLERLERYGENVVAQEKPKPAWLRLLELLASPLSLLSLVLAIVAELTGEVRGAIVITVMVALSVLLSFLQEFRSNRAAQQLRAMVHTTATVLRRDKREAIPAEVMRHFPVQLNVQPPQKLEIPLARLARGDVVLLSAGDMVPADVRLLTARDLFINQAALTGESLPVEKFAAACAAPAGATDFPNIAFMGSNVVSGSAQALVIATGGAARFGAIAQTVSGARELTSFDRGINGFFWLMIRFMAVMVPLVFAINGLTKGNWLEAFLFAVSVAVGLAPEMLPMIVTINLAKGALAMARKKAIVKRLNSIQNFGAMDMLCTDKTGTLTQDRVILEKHVDIEGNESEHVL
jgi:Mg2+-importing ATPase